MSIEIKNVTYTYMPGTPLERQALRGVSLTVADGSFTALAGHTGSGKSTLLQQFNGLLAPTAGEVLVDGVNLSPSAKDKAAQAAAKAARAKVGLVFQYPEQQLFEESVAADVAFGPRNQGLSEEEIEERVRETLALVGLDYGRYAQQSPFQLSGGQKRRVAIAGVLAMHPQYLVLDEPTAGLDPRGRASLLQMIRALHAEQGMTIIFVSHDMDDILSLADTLHVLDDGRLAASGAPLEVFRRAEVLEAAGLRQPELLQLLARLRADGLAVSDEAHDAEEAARLIRQALKGGRKDAE